MRYVCAMFSIRTYENLKIKKLGIMKKLLLLFTAMCSAMVMQAYIIKNVKYIDAHGVERICDQAEEVDNCKDPHKWENGWYLVGRDTEIANGGVVCTGDVHLIIDDDATLRIQGAEGHAGICVPEGNSLTIYGQTQQTGKLIVTGGSSGAGIGGNGGSAGYNITINGCIVIATGGARGAGIGGGEEANGYNITINGGTVTAIAGDPKNTEEIVDAIGSGYQGANSNDIFMADGMKVITDTTLIEHASVSEDIANKLVGKEIVKTLDLRSALKAINNAVGSSTDTTLVGIANTAKTSIVEDVSIATSDIIKLISDLAVEKINVIQSILSFTEDDSNARNTTFISEIISSIASATKVTDVDTKKASAMIAIPAFLTGRSSTLGSLGTKQNGPAVKVTDKDDKEIILYAPKKVEYIKVKEN